MAERDLNPRHPAYQAITLIRRPFQARCEQGCFSALYQLSYLPHENFGFWILDFKFNPKLFGVVERDLNPRPLEP
ncbi:hypothetical protein A4S05_17830 [Nostoc sp. KVJ20]|nr:hypothetical protein A4S05_17830 [Nostoc sp. KVJ20]